MKTRILAASAAALTLAWTQFASADCSEVAFADVGWTAETATTAMAMAGMILESLGYEVDIKLLSIPVTYTSMANDDIDAFIGKWMP